MKNTAIENPTPTADWHDIRRKTNIIRTAFLTLLLLTLLLAAN